jgi:serine protease Do
MIKALATSILIAGLAVPAVSSGPDAQPGAQPGAQPEIQAKNIEAVMATTQQGRSYLGVDIQDVTTDRVKALKLKEERGVEVTMVDQDAPAGKAGLKEHDVIMEFNGNKVDSEEQLRRMIKETPPGRNVTLGVSREGSPLKINVQLAERSKVIAESHARWPDAVVPPVPDMKGSGPRLAVPDVFITSSYTQVLGLQGEGLTRQLGEFFGVKNGEGILVRSVDKGSAADKAGVRAGDVIVKANNERLTDRSDLARILRGRREGGKITLGIVRDKHEQNVTVELQKRGGKDSSWLLDWDELGPLESLKELQASLRDLEIPAKVSMLIDNDVRTQLHCALAEIKSSRASARLAMRNAEEKLRQAERQLEKQKLKFNRNLEL